MDIGTDVAEGRCHDHDHDYGELLVAVRASFDAAATESTVLFKTDASGLFDLYLSGIPEGERQVHNCHACRHFIERFGGLVTIDAQGKTRAVMWTPAEGPWFYLNTMRGLAARVEKARVTGVFYSQVAVWGSPMTGEWKHLAVSPPRSTFNMGGKLDDNQMMAEKVEDFRTVSLALSELKVAHVAEALRLVRAGQVAQSERFLAPLEWLHALYDRPRGLARENVLWRAIATAPKGYCSPRGNVTGSLIDDIAGGLPLADIVRRFNAKVDATVFQRPQVAPTSGNVQRAEKLVAELGIEPSLHRRFARMDECPLFWYPPVTKAEAKAGGVFGHLETKDGAAKHQPAELPPVRMTWEKFTRTVLPSVTALEVNLLPTSGVGRFIGLTTAEHADAPPILKWDRAEDRNPVGWFCYPKGSNCSQWNISHHYAKVVGITSLPTTWTVPMAHEGEGMVLILEGCVDTADSGNGLFPQFLRMDLHEIRATVEAYSRTAKLGRPPLGEQVQLACGWDIRRGKSADQVIVYLRAKVDGGWSNYAIDRWD
jgi:hypothetical protein